MTTYTTSCIQFPAGNWMQLSWKVERKGWIKNYSKGEWNGWTIGLEVELYNSIRVKLGNLLQIYGIGNQFTREYHETEGAWPLEFVEIRDESLSLFKIIIIVITYYDFLKFSALSRLSLWKQLNEISSLNSLSFSLPLLLKVFVISFTKDE